MADKTRRLSDDEALCYLQRYAPHLYNSPKTRAEKVQVAAEHYNSTGATRRRYYIKMSTVWRQQVMRNGTGSRWGGFNRIAILQTTMI